MNLPSNSMAAVLNMLAAEDAGLDDPTLLDPQQGRALATLTNLRWNQDLPPVAQACNIMHAGMPARLIVPLNDAGTDSILHVHGGGWAFCSSATHEGAARRLAIACRAQVLTFDYRLAPEYPWPAGLEDVVEAWCACDGPRRWSIAGDSAGANLALAAMFRCLDSGIALPWQGLLFYGVYGADFTTPSYEEHADGPGLTREKMRRYWDWYALAEQRIAPDVVPLLATDASLSGLPSLYLNAAGLDPLRSETERLAQRLASLGREDVCDVVPGVVHGFMQMGSLLPEAAAAFDRAGQIFQKRNGRDNRPTNKEGINT